jgi:hypothetical protein
MTFGSPELLKQTEVYKKMYTEQMSVLKQIGFNTEVSYPRICLKI